MQGSHIATAAEHLQDVDWPELRETEIPGVEAGVACWYVRVLKIERFKGCFESANLIGETFRWVW